MGGFSPDPDFDIASIVVVFFLFNQNKKIDIDMNILKKHFVYVCVILHTRARNLANRPQ